MFVCLFVCLLVCFFCLFACMLACLLVCLLACLLVCVFVCLYVCVCRLFVSVCVFVLFAVCVCVCVSVLTMLTGQVCHWGLAIMVAEPGTWAPSTVELWKSQARPFWAFLKVKDASK